MPSPPTTSLPTPPALSTSPVPPAATGLLLTGGGARAAYQVGVLEALAELQPGCGAPAARNPFGVITGTSAGAINAAALASSADDFAGAVRRIAAVWHDFHTEQVYRADSLAMLDAPGRWRFLWGLGRLAREWLRLVPRSLLDNAPLATLLEGMVRLDRLPQLMQGGHLRALAVTASSYSSGEHVTFFDAATPMTPWVRSQRIAVSGRITHAHLLASSAIPFLFPSTGLELGGHTEYFGDGSMRQSAPIAAAIHLGAERILAIGASRMREPHEALAPNTFTGYPTLAQIAGHALSSIFLDSLAVDVERLQRINQTLSLIPPDARQGTHLRPVELLVISPSQRIDAIAARHVEALPGFVRRLFSGGGNTADSNALKGAALASYLLFDAGFTRELMALGRADAFAQREAICRFFGWG